MSVNVSMCICVCMCVLMPTKVYKYIEGFFEKIKTSEHAELKIYTFFYFF